MSVHILSKDKNDEEMKNEIEETMAELGYELIDFEDAISFVNLKKDKAITYSKSKEAIVITKFKNPDETYAVDLHLLLIASAYFSLLK